MPSFDFGTFLASRKGQSTMKDIGSGMGVSSPGDMPGEEAERMKTLGTTASIANPAIGVGTRAGHALKRAGKIPGMISGLAREFDYSPEEKKARASLGLTPSDSRVESLKGLSQDPNGYKNAKEFAGELAMSGVGKALGWMSLAMSPGLGMILVDLANKKHVESYKNYRNASMKGTDLDERKIAAKVFGESLEKADPKTQQYLMNQVGAKNVKDLYNKVIHPSGSSDPKLAGVWGAVYPSNTMREANQTGMSKEAKDAAKRWSKNANIMPVTGAKSPSDVSQPGFGKSLTEEEMVKNPMMKRLLGF